MTCKRAIRLHTHPDLVHKRHQCSPYGKYKCSVLCIHHHSNTFACTQLQTESNDKISYKNPMKIIWLIVHKFSNSMLTFTLNTITFVSVFASANIRSHSINAFSVFMTWMQIGRTFVDFSTIEFINTTKSGKAIAYIWTNCVFTHRIQVTMITVLTTLLCALINICKWTIMVFLVTDSALLLRKLHNFGQNTQTNLYNRSHFLGSQDDRYTNTLYWD